jgi:hypothetical protein
MSKYPDGHPTGVDYSAAEVTCPNGHRWIQHMTYERDTGASYPKDSEEVCPECGAEPDPTQDRPFDDEPQSQYDTREEWAEAHGG